MEFSDPTAAAKLRDLVFKMVERHLERIRPRYRYAVVNSVDRVARTAMVTYNGEPGNSVKVKMGAVQPYGTGAGNEVRIAGLPGDRYIDAVVKGKVYVDVGP